MKLRLLLPLALSLTFGCASKKSEAPQSTTAPSSFAAPAPAEAGGEANEEVGEKEKSKPAPAPSKGGTAVCTTTECREACEGKDPTPCAEAFAMGCFSDLPPAPETYDCKEFGLAASERDAEAGASEEAGESEPQINRGLRTRPERKEKKARLEDVMDEKDEDEEK